MLRDLDRLTGRTFDVLVVGGGVYGLTIAYDAAQRGLSVALVERDDFGSGASFNHLRTLHGGLRYLQTLDIARARESMRERRAIAAIASHTVHPLAFRLPLDRSITRGSWAMQAGFLLDQFIAFDRNRGIPPSHHLPAGRVESGMAVWYDYVATEADRLTFSFALAASTCGAVMANHTEAIGVIAEGPRITGVRARDRVSGRELGVSARITVNATGGSVDRLLDAIGGVTRIPMFRTMNLVTRREGGDAAIGGRSSSGRNLFCVPWRGRALFGTWESTTLCRGDAVVGEPEISAFIRDLNEAFPTFALTLDDVALVHKGVVPAVAKNGTLALEGHEQVRDHANEGERRFEGLVSVVGAKYTTARGVAERVTDRLLTKLHKAPVPCLTATTALPGGGIDDLKAAIAAARRDGGADLHPETASHLVAAYGSKYTDIFALCAERGGLKARLTDESPVIGAELVWAVRNEMALTLADAVVRRTPLGALGYAGDRAVERAAEIVAGELGWSPERRAAEIAELKAFYAPARLGRPGRSD